MLGISELHSKRFHLMLLSSCSRVFIPHDATHKQYSIERVASWNEYETPYPGTAKEWYTVLRIGCLKRGYFRVGGLEVPKIARKP